jgi:hypothetical protein
MSERYRKLYQKMVDVLEKLDPEELDRRSERRAAIDELPVIKLSDRRAAPIMANGPSTLLLHASRLRRTDAFGTASKTNPRISSML